MCKREHESFKEYAQRWRELVAQVVPSNDGERNDNNSRHITSVLLWKMVGYTPLSFADLVFTSERGEVGLKRGKFDHPTLMNAKTGANEEDENEGETLAMTTIPTRSNFPSAQQCHYSTNNIPSHLIIHKSHPQISHKACLLTTRPMPKHHL